MTTAAVRWGTTAAVDRLVPVQVAGTRRYRRVSAGLHFSCAVSLADKAFCWGENLWGQLGNGDRDDEDAPHSEYQTPTAVAGGLSFRQVAAGSSHACGRTLGGQAYCWGLNIRGALGDGSLDHAPHPAGRERRPEL